MASPWRGAGREHERRRMSESERDLQHAQGYQAGYEAQRGVEF